MAANNPVITMAFGPWEPDKAALGGQHAIEAKGVLPSPTGYEPLPSIQPEPGLSPLPGTMRGGYSIYSATGEPVTVVGNENTLFQYINRERRWHAAGTGYLDKNTRWRFARYGETIIAVNGVATPQYAVIEDADLIPLQFADISGAPVGTCVEVVREFVVIGGVERTKVRWCAIGNPLDWPAPGSNDAQYKQADEQDFPDTGNVMAITGGLSGMDALIFTERAIHRGTYVGPPFFFQFDILDKGRGTIAGQSVVTGSTAVYFLSEEGFFATNGATIAPIGFGKVNRWFRRVCSDERRVETRGSLDPATGIVYWTFPSLSAPDGMHDYVIIHHPRLDRWSYGKADSIGIFSNISHRKTLEDLDAIGPLDALPYSLDSPVWKGRVPGLAVFDRENRLCWASGMPMEATIDSVESGGQRVMVHGVRPLVDGAKASVAILHRDHQHQPPHAVACAPVSDFDGVAHTHISTRYARARVSIPAGQNWQFALGCEALTEMEGDI